MYSMTTLEQLVQRTEAVVARLQILDVHPDILLPDPPVPLSLNAIEEWVEAAEESCRKPDLPSRGDSSRKEADFSIS